MSKAQPVVSIICPTYNQEKFIAQTLDGFIMQKTRFPFEIIVHDDASTDNTAAIVREYEAKYPNIFANIYQVENQFSKGVLNVVKITFAAARGRYLALCEGDDYWTDAHKLEKQIGFLEAHPDYTVCTHAVYELLDGEERADQLTGEAKTYTIEDLAEYGNFLATVSVVFRYEAGNLPEWYYACTIGDYPLHMLNAAKGKIYYMQESMAAYRKFTGTFGPQTLSKKYASLYKTLAILIGKFGDPNIDRLLRRQQANCILYWYNNNAEEIVSEQDPLIKELLDMVIIRTPVQMARFKTRFLLASFFKKLSLLLAHNPVVNKLESFKVRRK